jgi:NDP-sugar pyrophosphorylase family protein
MVIVTDDAGRLVGTVTDGDIRRALIRGLDMGTSLDQVMNQTPLTTSLDSPRDEILRLMRDNELIHIPVLDHNGKIVRLDILPDLVTQHDYDVPALVMAGGFGKRLMPLTKACPKPMLKVGGKPILERIVERLAEDGFRKIFISVHYHKEVIVDFFCNGADWGVDIDYLEEKAPLGTAGAVGLITRSIADRPLVVINGDVVTSVDFRKLCEYHDQAGASATMCVRRYDFEVPYGVVVSSKDRVIEIEEKPVHEFFVNAGIYVLSKEAREGIDGAERLDMPDLLRQRILEGKTVCQFPLHEYWIDIGLKAHYEQAEIDWTDKANG